MNPIVEPWGPFLYYSGRWLLALFYKASSIALTIYALWYIAGLAAYLARGPAYPQGPPGGIAEERCEGCLHWPRVAVVYPIYNDYEVLASIRKALEMKYPDYFIIVADDSSDSRLAREISNLALRYEGRVYHMRRFSRRGFKAGALNDVARIAWEMGARYMLVLDADFEPEPLLLRKLVSIAEHSGADIVQGHQAHRKGVKDLFGFLYKAAMGGAIIFMTGRRHLGMFPIFTGSAGLLRIDKVLEVPFTEDSISEDLKWTIDYANVYGLEAYRATTVAEAVGSVPSDLKAFWKQQTRWSRGTTWELKRTFLDTMLNGFLPLREKAGYLLQGFFYGQGLAVYASTLIPYVCKYVFGCILGVWPFGLFVWFMGITTILLMGGVMERFRLWELVKLALFVIPFIYYTSLIHMQGFIRALVAGRGGWVVTPKRGEHEDLYRRASEE